LEPEGFVHFRGLKFYFRSEGEPDKGTLLVMHGGPGYPYDYLTPLFDIARHGFRVVIYEQAGSGKSDVPRDPARYTIESFVEDAEGVRKGLGLGRVHLLGFSWGGMLAQAYALKYQRNLTSLILSGTTPSIPLLQQEGARLFDQLPAGVRETITKHEEAGEFDDPEYAKATLEFQKRHTLRIFPVPDPMAYSDAHVNREVGRVMFGPHLIEVTGSMRYWDVTDRLRTLKLPCLVTCGEHDFLTPTLHRLMHSKIKGSKLVIIKGASHIAMWEKRGAYIRTVTGFLDSVKP
jgi:proline-specific peptidase